MVDSYRNYIAGKWVECRSKKTFPNVNPANTEDTVTAKSEKDNDGDWTLECSADGRSGEDDHPGLFLWTIPAEGNGE